MLMDRLVSYGTQYEVNSYNLASDHRRTTAPISSSNISNKFAELSHLLWSLGTLTQARISTLDYSYKEYEQLTFEKHLEFKTKLFEALR
ncbi:unnamed protein product [Didymodactylos carnosus]|uniref:Uncharacterized protein n=1 Tax=Didymodactylos carnosus TaxID=1234261 RepID=A0A814ZBV1_9BILA|nr:unnamed protein product [Didymodactylos carnosus]CAF1242005.1 unnamed protein product [Didymodactylos carnosus]CAF3722774.1 unnamed protein product [Didymodactylos carnosus]CAF4005497.1 unnamed protein product [Didymodactylos carnosus]